MSMTYRRIIYSLALSVLFLLLVSYLLSVYLHRSSQTSVIPSALIAPTPSTEIFQAPMAKFKLTLPSDWQIINNTTENCAYVKLNRNSCRDSYYFNSPNDDDIFIEYFIAGRSIVSGSLISTYTFREIYTPGVSIQDIQTILIPKLGIVYLVSIGNNTNKSDTHRWVYLDKPVNKTKIPTLGESFYPFPKFNLYIPSPNGEQIVIVLSYPSNRSFNSPSVQQGIQILKSLSYQ